MPRRSLLRAASGPGLVPAEFIAYRGARGTFDTRSYYQAVTPGLLPDGHHPQGEGMALGTGHRFEGLTLEKTNPALQRPGPLALGANEMRTIHCSLRGNTG